MITGQSSPLLSFIARICPWPIWWGTGQELMAGPKRGRSLARDDTEPGDRSKNLVSSALGRAPESITIGKTDQIEGCGNSGAREDTRRRETQPKSGGRI